MRRLASALFTALALSGCEGDVALPDDDTTGATSDESSGSSTPTSGEGESSETAAETTGAGSACPPLRLDLPVFPFAEDPLDRAGAPAPPPVPTTYTCVIDFNYPLPEGTDVARVVVELGEGRPFVYGDEPVVDCQHDPGWWYPDAERAALELCGAPCEAFQMAAIVTIEFTCGE